MKSLFEEKWHSLQNPECEMQIIPDYRLQI